MRKRINSGQSSPSIEDKHHLPQHHSEEEEEHAQLLVELTPHRRLVAQHHHPSDVDLEHPSAAYQGVDNELFGSTDNPKYHHQQHVRSLKAVATNAIHSIFRIWASCSSNAFICPRILLSGSTTTSSTTTGATDVIFNGKAYRRKRSLLRSILLFSLLFLPFFFTLTILLGNLTSKNGIVHYETAGKGNFRKQRTKRIILSPQDLAMPQYRTQTQPYKSQSTSFAVVINTFRRPDMLKLSLDHWVNTCGRNDVHSKIAKVYVVWAEVDKIPPRPEDVLPPPKDGSSVGGPEVQFLRVPKDSLNSRFLPIDELIQTSSENSSSSLPSSSSSTLTSTVEAVFMVDDDVRVDCESMWEGFEAWRHHPSSLVGFYPRLASPSLKHPWFGQPSSPSKTQTRMVYHTWPVVYGRQKFNIILTKASFFHKMYLEMYHDDKENPREVLDYVDQHKNCEDIAMAFLVARHAKSKRTQQTQHNQEEPFYCVDCPVYIHGKIQDLGLFNGISTSGGSLAPSGHMEKRSMCLDALTDIYKEKRGWEYPLWDVSLSDQSWTHTFGWWLNAPSNVYEWFSFGNTFM